MNNTQTHGTSLLDEYLQKTAASPAKVLSQQLSAPADGLMSDASQAPLLAGKLALQSVHQALDDIIASSGEQRAANALPKPYNAPAAQQPQASSPTKGPAGGTSPLKRSSSKHGISGIFRAMRQADAAAVLTEHFRREQEQQGQQQPVLMAPADGSTGAVRVIASNAALQAKLQRLQSDMDARSYRQDLLQQLQCPDALFQQQHATQQLQGHSSTHHHMRSNSIDVQQSSRRRASNNHAYHGVFTALVQDGKTVRPATSPALMGRLADTWPTAAYSCAATAANSRRSSSMDAAGYATLPHQTCPGKAQLPNANGTATVTGERQQPQQQYRHVQQLAKFELPWKSPCSLAAAKQGSCSSSSRRNKGLDTSQPSATVSVSKHHTWNNTGLNSSSSSSSKLLRSSAFSTTPERQTMLGSVTVQNGTQHKYQQQQQSLHRPASAVAALEQSLNELALLKSKYTVQQQQQQQQTYHNSKGQQQQQQARSHATWLAEPSLQHFHEAVEADIGSFVAGVAAAGLHGSKLQAAGCSIARARPATAHGLSAVASCTMHQHPSSLHAQAHRPSMSPGYDLSSTWQQPSHSQKQQQAPAAAGCSGKFSSHLYRAKSAPRQLRAWDILPLPAAAAATATGGLPMRSRRHSCSETARLSGHLQQLRQQQQHRPLTAAAAFDSYTQPVQGRAGNRVRPLAPHNHMTAATTTSSRSVCASWKQTAAGARASDRFVVNPSCSSTSAWLLSSPLRRAQQSAAGGGSGSSSRFRTGSAGGVTAASGEGSAGGARGRATAVAATLAQLQASSADATMPAVGSTAAAAVPGRATAAALQLLHQVKAGAVSTQCTKNDSKAMMRSPTKVYADRLAAAAAGCMRSSAGACVPLTTQVLEYAAGRYSTCQGKRSSSRSGSSNSSESSELVRSQNVSGALNTQAAYAAALARVRAASRAAHDDDDARRRRDRSDDEN